MKLSKDRISAVVCIILSLAVIGLAGESRGGSSAAEVKPPTAEKLGFHNIKTDEQGKIMPWHGPNLGESYDHTINLVWNFWDNMRSDRNGIPYFMSHQVWQENRNDPRGLGGDQLQMALSSWALLYMYSGDGRVLDNMKFIADYYLTHSLSKADAKWPNIPYPYNTYLYSGIYDGDMIIGKGYTQPDKAGSLGIELITLYKIANNENYLNDAIKIADTLAMHTKPGDVNNSPLPFKVHAETGEVGVLINYYTRKIDGRCTYTTNWTGTMQLFTELIKMNKGSVDSYKKAFDMFHAWMQEYPLNNNKWGPFFEDVPGWSDTQINAVTYAMYIMQNPALFPNWKQDARKILDWPWERLSNKKWEKYGVVVMNEQTEYLQPGNSHSSRQASMELLYAKLTGDDTRKENAIRMLNWATYMVDTDGKNDYLNAGVWMTDGYGDYVRHYLRAMAACPELAPDNNDHILSSTSVVTSVNYDPRRYRGTHQERLRGKLDNLRIIYKTYDASGTEVIRLTGKPGAIYGDGETLAEVQAPEDHGWRWQSLEKGGVLTVKRDKATEIIVAR